MKRACPAFLFAVGLLGVAGLAEASFLRMQWRGLGPDDAEITLAVGETAIIDIYFEMTPPDESTLASLSFENFHWTGRISQIATEAAHPGWQDLSIDGVLGDGTQKVDWSADPGFHVIGPGEYLIGSQTIRLDSFGDGDQAEIYFHYDRIELWDASGDAYVYAPAYAGTYAQYYGIGLGHLCADSPFSCEDHPLIVNPIPEPRGLALLALGAVMTLRRRR